MEEKAGGLDDGPGAARRNAGRWRREVAAVARGVAGGVGGSRPKGADGVEPPFVEDDGRVGRPPLLASA